jgi:hypothetical protein
MSFHAFVNAVCGASGGFVSSVVLFPLDAIKTTLQATKGETSSAEVARKIYDRDGIVGFWHMSHYRGLSSAYEKFCYFYIYKYLRDAYSSRLGDIGPLTSLAIGYVSEWAHKPFTYPNDTVVNRCIKRRRTWLDVATELQREGVGAAYRGLDSFALGAFKGSFQFAIYENIKARQLIRNKGGALSALQAFILGAISRCIADLITYPTRTIKVAVPYQPCSPLSFVFGFLDTEAKLPIKW